MLFWELVHSMLSLDIDKSICLSKFKLGMDNIHKVGRVSVLILLFYFPDYCTEWNAGKTILCDIDHFKKMFLEFGVKHARIRIYAGPNANLHSRTKTSSMVSLAPKSSIASFIFYRWIMNNAKMNIKNSFSPVK